MSFMYLLVVGGLLVCAVQAIRAGRQLLSALWLAGSSALTALLMYLLGAPEVAVIELSVGAGLVTVLFVFAINIAGEESLRNTPVVPRPLAWLLVIGVLLLLAWMNLGLLGVPVSVLSTAAFGNVVWGDRRLDIYLQIALIFAGVLGVLGLMAESQPGAADRVPLKRSDLPGETVSLPLQPEDLAVEDERAPDPVMQGVEEKRL